jgi:hypothetical protein
VLGRAGIAAVISLEAAIVAILLVGVPIGTMMLRQRHHPGSSEPGPSGVDHATKLESASRL